MSERISLVEMESSSKLLQRIFKQMGQAYGEVPHTARALAHIPEFVTATAGLAKIESLDGPLGRELKFLAKLRVAHLNQCAFCIDIGNARARKEDLLDLQKLQALEADDALTAEQWSPEERIVLEYTDAMTRTMTIPDELFARTRELFTEAQIVELTAQIATETFYNILNRAWGIGAQGFLDALDADGTKEQEG